MAYTPKILAIPGSLREKSYNKMLARVAAKGAEAAGAEVTVIDLRDFIPDVEKELPITSTRDVVGFVQFSLRGIFDTRDAFVQAAVQGRRPETP